MIVVFHHNEKVSEILDLNKGEQLPVEFKSISKAIFKLAEKYQNSFLVWCHVDLKDQLNDKFLNATKLKSFQLQSFETSNSYFIDERIGLIEQTPFINVNKKVQYPTWLTSSDVGVVHANTLIKYKELISFNLSFDLLLLYLAKQGMMQGLLCYSNPELLMDSSNQSIKKKGIGTIAFFQFIKSNYKKKWIHFFLMSNLILNKQFLLPSYLVQLFKRRITLKGRIDKKSETSVPIDLNTTVDVVIPTLGRATYLEDVLNDLAAQSLKPKKVIIIEQKLKLDEGSDLDYLTDHWPFKIEHVLIDHLGACNARNIGLEHVSDEWIFFADDDVRFGNDLLEKSIQALHHFEVKGITLSCLQKNEIEPQDQIIQWASFASGASIVKSSSLNDTVFSPVFEHGYGEDADFGMQLRNIGIDILYVPDLKMLHLKAPIGGFREKFENDWDKEKIQPKPSPTIMAYNLKHLTTFQLKGYKLVLFLKFYRKQAIKNPFSYYAMMKNAWNKSIFWGNHLIQKYES